MIRQNVNLQARLIDDLLDVMRIVRGKMPLHWEVADAHDLIRQAVQICRSEVFGKELRPRRSTWPPADHHVNADPARLQQVFWNLIKNAVKFTPEGGSIAIRTRNEADADGPASRLVIEVADTGIGIEPERPAPDLRPVPAGRDRRSPAGSAAWAWAWRSARGSSRRTAGPIDGREPGQGPGDDLPGRPRRPARAPGRRPTAGRRPRRRPRPSRPAAAALKILVVEDEPATRRLMARLLRGLGHEVTTAGTIAEALEAASRAGDFDLIVSDIGLPDGSGLDLMRRVVARRGPVPAIALTGYGMEEDIRRSREAGFTAHMTKPIDFTKLEAMIRQVAPSRS